MSERVALMDRRRIRRLKWRWMGSIKNELRENCRVRRPNPRGQDYKEISSMDWCSTHNQKLRNFVCSSKLSML